jgi:hypothetical protein
MQRPVQAAAAKLFSNYQKDFESYVYVEYSIHKQAVEKGFVTHGIVGNRALKSLLMDIERRCFLPKGYFGHFFNSPLERHRRRPPHENRADDPG